MKHYVVPKCEIILISKTVLKNYEHYGIPYIKNLDKALTPKRGW